MDLLHVVVLGGYGFFGGRLVQRLSRQSGLYVTVAGRDLNKGLALVSELAYTSSRLTAARLDVQAADFAQQLRELTPDVVIHTCGPFQRQGYDVALACIQAGAHYIDLADGRDFVCGITQLDQPALAAGVSVLSGASSVPALSSAVVDSFAAELNRLDTIDIGISPGNRTERGLATVQAILGYCGKPMPHGAYGWSGTWRHNYGASVGERLLSPCDVPDLALLPNRYSGAPSVRFGAGLELRTLHRGMNLMAEITRRGLVSDWARYASQLKRAADWFKGLGSDAGAMHVRVTGSTPEGAAASHEWELLATAGDGPYVPTLAAAALVHKLRSGGALPAGARPCVGVLSVQDIVAQASGLSIECGVRS